MTSNSARPEGARPVAAAVARGFLGRCPACGARGLFSGYLTQSRACAACGAPLAGYHSADIAPYLVTFALGLVFVPLTLFLSLSSAFGVWLTPALAACALTCAAILLPRAKGAVVGLHWALDLHAAPMAAAPPDTPEGGEPPATDARL